MKSTWITVAVAAVLAGLTLLALGASIGQDEEWPHELIVTDAPSFVLLNDPHTTIELIYSVQDGDTQTRLTQMDFVPGYERAETHPVPANVVIRLSGRVVVFKGGGTNRPLTLRWRYVSP